MTGGDSSRRPGRPPDRPPEPRPERPPERRQGTSPELGARFAARLKEDGTLDSGDRVVVALSGGLDSVVLLHLLRFGANIPRLELIPAHFDHRMRPESERDLLWVAGVCRAWGIPMRAGRAESIPASEEEARDRRYDFLLDVKDREGAGWVLTGHHGDDQAETILFRVLRGTGLRGLGGMPAERAPGVYRPLLPFFREELLDYASSKGLRFLNDPTNADVSYVRNYLRHRILAPLRVGPIPGVRSALLRLGRLAREEEEAWESLLPRLMEGVVSDREGETFMVRSALLAYHPAVRTRLLREVFRRVGIELDEVGTQAAVEFTSSGASGRSIHLPGGMRLTREFDRFRLFRRKGELGGKSLLIREVAPGAGTLTLGGGHFRVSWGFDPPEDFPEWVGIPQAEVHLPLELRGWEPGDKILLSYGSKKLKKLFGEERVPLEDRCRIPVLLDAGGRVLWVPGVASSPLVQPGAQDGAFFLGIGNVDG